MRIVLILLTFIIASCSKTLPQNEIRSLSGKDYVSLRNNRIHLVHDFSQAVNFMVGESIKVPGGMFFTTEEFTINFWGQDLYYFDDATKEAYLVNDLRPGADSAEVSNFQDPGGDYIYFLADTMNQGTELHRVHKTTFEVEMLPEGFVGENSSFEDTDDENTLLIFSENPLVVYGAAYSYNATNTVLVEYTYDGSTVTYGEVQVSAGNPGNYTAGDYIAWPKFLTKMNGNVSGTSTPMVFLSYTNGYPVAIEPTGNVFDYSHQVTGVDQVVLLDDASGVMSSPHFIGQYLTNPKKIYLYSYNQGVGVGTSTIDNVTFGNAFDFGQNIQELHVHKGKLWYITDLKEYTVTPGLNPLANLYICRNTRGGSWGL